MIGARTTSRVAVCRRARRLSPSMVGWPMQSVIEQAAVYTLSRAFFLVRAAWVDALVFSIAMVRAACTAGRDPELGASVTWGRLRGQRRDHRKVGRAVRSGGCVAVERRLSAWTFFCVLRLLRGARGHDSFERSGVAASPRALCESKHMQRNRPNTSRRSFVALLLMYFVACSRVGRRRRHMYRPFFLRGRCRCRCRPTFRRFQAPSFCSSPLSAS